MNPLVSVIIPCYRQADLLPQALESVFAQTYSAIEPVVVNDGSPDHTHEVATAYGNKITYVRQENRGLPAARNAGIKSSSGKYLLFLDADDLLRRDAVQKLVEKTGGSEHTLVLNGYSTFSSSPSAESVPVFLPREDGLFPGLIHENLGPVHSYLCPRAAVDRIGGFEESLRACEDWDLWLRLAITGIGFTTVREVGAYYRMAPGSMSTNRERMLEARAIVLLRTIEGFSDTPALFAKWGGELAVAAKRVRRRLRAQGIRRDLNDRLTSVLDELSGQGFRPPVAGKEAILECLLGRDRADRLVLSFYRRFVPPAFQTYTNGYA